MEVRYHNSFKKSYKSRIQPNSKLQKQFKQRLKLFILNRNNPMLKDHSLKGNLQGLRSFSVSGDLRVIYIQTGATILLVDIGSHNQVY